MTSSPCLSKTIPKPIPDTHKPSLDVYIPVVLTPRGSLRLLNHVESFFDLRGHASYIGIHVSAYAKTTLGRASWRSESLGIFWNCSLCGLAVLGLSLQIIKISDIKRRATVHPPCILPRKLYSEIVRIDPDRAGRITGMMLEILGALMLTGPWMTLLPFSNRMRNHADFVEDV